MAVIQEIFSKSKEEQLGKKLKYKQFTFFWKVLQQERISDLNKYEKCWKKHT